MKDFKGDEIVRPRCPTCRVEMKWDTYGNYSDGCGGYYCLTEGCTFYRMSEQQIIDYVSPCKRVESAS